MRYAAGASGGPGLSTAPRVDIDVAAFWHDPYPTLAKLRREAPIAYVPQLSSTLLCGRDDIFVSEKQIDVFSSHQPEGLMNKLMGRNMMRKDGDAHLSERKAIFPAVSPKTVRAHWTAQFQAHADRIIDALHCERWSHRCRKRQIAVGRPLRRCEVPNQIAAELGMDVRR
jgi:cytochrome P450